jgi:PEGA domain
MLTEPAAARASSTVLRGFEDGLGRRYRPATSGEQDAPLEILCLRHEITDVPSFEFALRERVARLADFHHPYYARVRRVDRLSDERVTVALMSDGAPGVRLIDLLTAADRGGPFLDLSAALCLVRQLVQALAVFHEQARVAHGAIAPERLFVSPLARLFVTEYVMGEALEQLQYSPERYWKELRVALPAAGGRARFDERADLTQVGVVALALMMSRPLHDDEYPGQIEGLVGSASARAADGSRAPLPADAGEWLRRALQLEVRGSFRTFLEAQTALDQLLSGEGKCRADVRSLEMFLERYRSWIKRTPSSAIPIAAPAAPMPPVQVQIETPAPKPLDPEPRWAVETATVPETLPEEWSEPEAPSAPFSGRLKWIAAGLVLMVATTGLFAARRRLSPADAPVTTGTMTVNTNVPGAEVLVDGATLGQTPLNLSLAAGTHTLVIRGNGTTRTMPITIAAGAQLSQYLELPKAASAVGQLQVRTEPTGVHVIIDGVQRGTSPLTVAELSPGTHSVRLESDLGSVAQNVTIEAGVTASLVVPLAAAQGASLSGWVSVRSPVVVELFEQGRLLGTSGIDRIMLPTGKHDIDLVNEPLGLRETSTVQVSPGKVSPISITPPKGNVSLNAIPWATVSIDGENVGDTPIGNLPIAIGPHEVVFRNAQLGEQRRTITVTLRSPARLSVDLTKP